MTDDERLTLDCRRIRGLLADLEVGRLDAAARDAVTEHLRTCDACRARAALEAALSDALQRLPRHRAPLALKRRLTEALLTPASIAAPPGTTTRARGWGWAAPFVSACAATALVVVVMRAPLPVHTDGGPDEMVREAANDHIRVITSLHPVEIESGGIHQVKPWFTGKLEFAPRIGFSGDADFPLQGGNVGYFRDRKAAVFMFKRRLHAITLLVFPAGDLPWPTERATRVGSLSVTEDISRGFSVLLWRDQGLGYALVSDANVHDLEQLAVKINQD